MLTPEQQQEIKELRENKYETRRATVPELEEILYESFPVLDHGFMRVIDYMGNDSAIVQAARVSYGKGTKQSNQDKGLINYLLRHRHTTPFEMCEIKFHFKMPIFIARQWIRHRTANVNEYSGRYSIMDKEFYIPAPEEVAMQSTENHQGRGDSVSKEQAEELIKILRADAEKNFEDYNDMLDKGLARELARINLTLNTYTQWYWKIDLHNLLHFLALRADSHAQYEIRVYAEKMLDVVKRWVPFTYEAFMEHRVGSSSVSKTGLEVIKRMIGGEKVTQENSGLTKREWGELMGSIGVEG
ncbi:MAG: FAD-dependent thymidylate synthase [Alphaproteobacteria bacterium]|nr:FAD-dependent thymidylate synthase [Alphaproteobacteria bacterium]